MASLCLIIDELFCPLVSEEFHSSIIATAHENVKLRVVINWIIVVGFVRDKVLKHLTKIVITVPNEYNRIRAAGQQVSVPVLPN